jgi:hypothetical protein
VYRKDRAVVVPLPEARIEFDSPAQRRAVREMLDNCPSTECAIIEDTSDRIVVRPLSGSGSDALKLANEIYERAHPAAASVRFIQFVPKPDVR